MLATLATMPATAAGAPADAEVGWAAVTRCAQQRNEQARHTCVDQVLREAGLLNQQVPIRESQRMAEPVTKVLPAAAPPQAPPPPPALPQAGPASEPERLRTVVASATASADGRLTVTTSEGSVWRQTETLRIPRAPSTGDAMDIRKGALGGYICAVGSNPAYRCARIH